MYPGKHAQERPDHPAVIMAGSGERITYRELEDRSNRLAQLLWDAGLRRGDGVTILMENNPRYFEVFWAAMRSGLYLTSINRYLTPEEAAYIVNDSGAKALIASAALAGTATGMLPLIPDTPVRLMADGAADGFDGYEDAVAAFPAEPLAEQPKGIRRPLTDEDITAGPGGVVALQQSVWGFGPDTVYLSPAPMYHSAPLGFSSGTQGLGGTVVVMEKFDAVEAIRCIDRYGVTHSQWVPTMFTRMLKLDASEREVLDGSTHRVAIHAAAPCPVEVKRQMLDWWGPILWEYYGGTEINGLVLCDSQGWLSHPGTVGRAVLGVLHICDDEGNELPNGEAGLIYFERETMPFAYHNDPEKTREAQHPQHPNWSTLGDVGYVDDEGWLYLTDRKSFMIISGGVNIYPQEIEDAMVMHPDIADVAVIGVPDQEMGEAVKAVVQLAPGVEPTPERERELLAWTRERIAHFKAPRSLDFIDELPRLPTGKLYTRLLRDRYWEGHQSRIV